MSKRTGKLTPTFICSKPNVWSIHGQAILTAWTDWRDSWKTLKRPPSTWSHFNIEVGLYFPMGLHFAKSIKVVLQTGLHWAVSVKVGSQMDEHIAVILTRHTNGFTFGSVRWSRLTNVSTLDSVHWSRFTNGPTLCSSVNAGSYARERNQHVAVSAKLG